MNLLEQAKSFYKSLGCDVQEKERNFIVAEKTGTGGEIERTCIWVLFQQLKQNRNQIALEEELLTRFKGTSKKYPSATLRLLVDSMEGLTAEFKTNANRLCRVRIQVPCQLFDMPFSWETARVAATVTKELYEESIKCEAKRVPQSFFQPFISEVRQDHDLVSAILQEIESSIGSDEARVWFVVAPAGHGKSVFFSSVFGELYKRFQENKKALRNYPRPLPLVASHLHEAAGQNIMGLIDAFMRTEFAALSTREFFNWMIDQQYGLLMIDGLDEVITRDPLFLNYLEERILAPNSQPGVLICVRDSLFTSNEDLSDFLDYYKSITQTYYLKPWEQKAKRIHAWIGLEGKPPRPGEHDTPAVMRFLKVLESNKTLAHLSSTPFYADLLLTTYSEKAGDIPGRETELVEFAINQMCEREYSKGTLDKDIFPPKAFRDWLEELSALSYPTGSISIDDLRALAELAEALTSRNLSEREKDSLIDHISMAPFLTRNAISGNIELTHEIFSEYLAGHRFIKEFETSPTLFASRLSQKEWPYDSMLFPVLEQGLSDKLDKLVSLSLGVTLTPEGFRNLIQLVSRIRGGDAFFRTRKLELEGSRLQALRFIDVNLEGVSFRGADLTNVVFKNCKLTNAKFEGAILRGTSLLDIPVGGLIEASFGDCEQFYSVIIDKGRVEDIDKFKTWASEHTGRKEKVSGPCPSTRQLLFLFHKYIHVDGQGRRDIHDRRALLRGKQIPNALSIEDILQSAIEFGYLEERERDRIRRASGPKYGEMVSFVKSQVLSPGLRSLLDSLCRISNCKHICS